MRPDESIPFRGLAILVRVDQLFRVVANAVQARRVKARAGPCGLAESRTAMPSGAGAVSIQLPLPLWVLFRHSAWDRSCPVVAIRVSLCR
jgi:hypothetical protein